MAGDAEAAYPARHAGLLTAHQALVDQGLIAPLDLSDQRAQRLWQDMDLAIMIEGCFHQPVDPRSLGADDAQRAWWLSRLGEDVYEPPTWSEGPLYSRPYWLLRDGQQVGTIALGCTTTGPALVPITGLYVLREHRGQDLGGRTLRAFYQAVRAQRCRGLRLDTYWIWQSIVRYYLRRKFWVYMWKHELTLYWGDYLPRDYRIEVTDTAARFRILEAEGGEWVDLFQARRAPAAGFGELLVLEETARALRASAERDLGLLCPAESTFALGLAVAGWPLFQATENRSKGWLGDAGRTDSLALRIEAYEAWARHRGWVVDAPPLPGMLYRGYAELDGDEDG